MIICMLPRMQFKKTYEAVQSNLRKGPWYIEADMHSGKSTYEHFNSLQVLCLARFDPFLKLYFFSTCPGILAGPAGSVRGHSKRDWDANGILWSLAKVRGTSGALLDPFSPSPQHRKVLSPTARVDRKHLVSGSVLFIFLFIPYKWREMTIQLLFQRKFQRASFKLSPRQNRTNLCLKYNFSTKQHVWEVLHEIYFSVKFWRKRAVQNQGFLAFGGDIFDHFVFVSLLWVAVASSSRRRFRLLFLFGVWT